MIPSRGASWAAFCRAARAAAWSPRASASSPSRCSRRGVGQCPRDRREERVDLGPALLRLGLPAEAGEADRLHGVAFGPQLRLLDLLAQDALGLGERLPVAAEVRLEPRAEEPRPHPLLGVAPGLRSLGREAARLADVPAVEAGHGQARAALPLLAGVVRGREALRRRLGLGPLVPEGVGREAAHLDLHRVVGVQSRRLVERGERGLGPALGQLEVGEVLEAGRAVGVLGRVLGERLARLVRAPGGHVGLGQAQVAGREGHPSPAQVLEVHERLGVALHLEEQLRQVVARRGLLGSLVHRPLVGLDRLLDRGRVERVVAPLDVEALAGREIAGLLHRLRRVRARLVDVAEVALDDRELGEGHREAGVGLDRLLEEGPRLLLLQAFVEAAALGVGLPRLDRGRGDLLELLLLPGGVPPVDHPRRRRRLEPPPHAPRQLVHEGEEAVLGVALDPLGGDHLAVLGVLQGRLDPDLRPGAHEAADEGGRGLRLARHRLHDRGRHRAVVAVAGLVEQLVEAGGAQHAQAGRLREVRDQHVGQAGAQPVELRVGGQVVEVEDGHRAPAVLGGGGRPGRGETARPSPPRPRARRRSRRAAPSGASAPPGPRAVSGRRWCRGRAPRCPRRA